MEMSSFNKKKRGGGGSGQGSAKKSSGASNANSAADEVLPGMEGLEFEDPFADEFEAEEYDDAAIEKEAEEETEEYDDDGDAENAGENDEDEWTGSLDWVPLFYCNHCEKATPGHVVCFECSMPNNGDED